MRPDWREWWVFFIDPTKDEWPGRWETAGNICGPFSAEEAIERLVGRRFETPFWAFALNKANFSSYYKLHYPGNPYKSLLNAPSGYVAE